MSQMERRTYTGPKLAALSSEQAHFLGVGALLISVDNTLEVVPSAAAISHHKVVLPQLVETEEIKRLQGQCLVVETEGEPVVAVEGVGPPELAVHDNSVGALLAYLFEEFDGTPIVTIQPDRNGQTEPCEWTVVHLHQALVHLNGRTVALLGDVEFPKTFKDFALLRWLHRVSALVRGEKSFIGLSGLAMIA